MTAPSTVTSRAGRCLDADADVRMLEIFLAELLGQLLVELRGGQVRRFDLADQRQRDVPGQIDLVIAGQVLGFEDLDRHCVHRRDLVVGSSEA